MKRTGRAQVCAAGSFCNSLENSGFTGPLMRTSQHVAHPAQEWKMSALRKVAVSAVLPLALLIQACDRDEPGFRQDLDVSQHLASIPGTWQNQPVKRTEVKV